MKICQMFIKFNCSFPPKSMERSIGSTGSGSSGLSGGVNVGIGNSGGQYYMSVLPGSHATNSDGESYVYLQQHCVPPPPAISALTGSSLVNNYDDIKGPPSDAHHISVHTHSDHPSTAMVHHHPEQVSASTGSYTTGIRE